MAQTLYWVVGGTYHASLAEDTKDPVQEKEHAMHASNRTKSTEEERYGPFTTYADALLEWQKHAWATVDQCDKRYRIIEVS